MATQAEKPVVCPQCRKAYGINVRKDGTIRCKLCGYEGTALYELPRRITQTDQPSLE